MPIKSFYLLFCYFISNATAVDWDQRLITIFACPGAMLNLGLHWRCFYVNGKETSCLWRHENWSLLIHLRQNGTIHCLAWVYYCESGPEHWPNRYHPWTTCCCLPINTWHDWARPHHLSHQPENTLAPEPILHRAFYEGKTDRMHRGIRTRPNMQATWKTLVMYDSLTP